MCPLEKSDRQKMSPLKSGDDVGFPCRSTGALGGAGAGDEGFHEAIYDDPPVLRSRRVPRRSLAVALVVGTVLNLINQGDALFGAHPLNPTKLLLTYLVPYCVATYGAVSYQLVRRRPAGLTLLRSDRDRTAIADLRRPI
jgi:hypothetical protein